MNRSVRQLTPKNSTRGSPNKSARSNELFSPRQNTGRSSIGNISNRSLERSIISRGIISTSDDPDSFATLIRKCLIITNFVVILWSLALLGLSTWFLIPTSHRLVILGVQNSQLFFSLIIINLSVALLMILVSTVGMVITAKSNSRGLLWTKGIVYGLLSSLSILLVIICFAYATQMEIILRIEVQKRLDSKYVSETSKDDTSLGWNTIHLKLDCCGKNSYKDWINTDWFSTNESLTDIFSIGAFRKQWPVSCCKLSDETSNRYLESEKFEPKLQELINCYNQQPEPSDNVNQNGCFKDIETIFKFIPYITAAFFIVLFLLLTVYSLLVYAIFRDYSVEVVENH